MRITHLGHACLLVETSGARMLIDPGTFSSGYQNLRDLDAVLLTHQHPDHVDVEELPDLMRANPGALLLAEPETVDFLESPIATPFGVGGSRSFGGLSVSAVGGRHAVNHDRVPVIGNVGLLIREQGGPTLFHPGDSYTDTPDGVDVLAFPLSAPWCKMSETLGFVRAVPAPVLVPIHDGALNDDGRSTYLMHVDTFGPADSELRDLSDGAAYDV